jgi:hypothetical protein
VGGASKGPRRRRSVFWGAQNIKDYEVKYVNYTVWPKVASHAMFSHRNDVIHGYRQLCDTAGASLPERSGQCVTVEGRHF